MVHQRAPHIFLARPAQKAKDFLSLSRDQGWEVEVFSPLKFQRLSLGPKEVQLVQKKGHWDGLIFGSPIGVEYFWEIIQDHNLSLPSTLLIGGVGETTIHALIERGVSQPLWAPSLQNLIHQMAKEFEKTPRKNGDTKKILRITSVEGKNNISICSPPQLEITCLPLYQQMVAQPFPEEERRRYITKSYDFGIFGSPSFVDVTLKILGESFFSQIRTLVAFGSTTQNHLCNLFQREVLLPPEPKAPILFEFLQDLWRAKA